MKKSQQSMQDSQKGENKNAKSDESERKSGEKKGGALTQLGKTILQVKPHTPKPQTAEPKNLNIKTEDLEQFAVDPNDFDLERGYFTKFSPKITLNIK